ncbi:dephospho-CoA kinase [Arenimonas fontis]|uniref:Dephospho-CoA kinase n=1 Tax=Arenimonas fontis TaxID=2608255 RepID=A0A5B2ZBL3_9GAMM|nr:dephospho-CoA kinase [Arenimonas fontis]KAA2284933.1 dephospho-CoA kinase [Arenimonas fontis]
MADRVIAVTGGVASGKSAACQAFADLGVHVADADLAARVVVEPGQPALAEVVAAFGPEVLQPDGRLDRATMRQRVFADPVARKRLEGLLHPRIRERLKVECAQAPGPYVVVAIPLLAEGGGRAAYPWLDRVLVVDVPEAVQTARLRARDGIEAGLAQRMIAAQASRAQRLALADDVIVNDGSPADLRAAVGRLHARYLSAQRPTATRA